MIRVEIEDQKYLIEWEHYHARCAGAHSMGGTRCAIYEGEDTDQLPVWQGGAFLAPGDRFEKEIGRKVSLTRALESWPREKRKQVWNAYFNRKGVK